MNIYAFENHLALLRALVEENESLPAYRSKLAKAAGMHLSYLTRVLKGETHLTADHAAAIAEFMNLDATDSSYFLSLVLRDRAGTPRLEAILSRQLAAIRKARDRGGLPKAPPTSSEVATEFCSDWPLSAIYAALRIPALDTEATLVKRFQLPASVVNEALERLAAIGLVMQSGARWEIRDSAHLYIDGRSWQGQSHARNWRSQICARRVPLQEDELTYTSVFAVSRADAARIRGTLREALNQVYEIVEASAPEEVFILAADFGRA